MLVEWLYVNKPSAKGLKKIDPRAFGGEISSGVFCLLQLEVDIHRVAIASAEAARQWVDTGHALERREDRCVHDRVSAATNDVGAGNGPIFQNPDFHRANKRFILLKYRCRLFPLAKKAVMDEFVIPPKLVGVSTSTRLSSSAGTAGGRPLALGVRIRFPFGVRSIFG